MRRYVLITIVFVAVCAVCIVYAWWRNDWGHAAVERLEWIHGKSLETVLEHLGEPDLRIEYAMKDCPGGEMRVGLYNTYPPTDPLTRDVRILELQWNHVPYSIAIWLHWIDGNWVVLDTLRWKSHLTF